MSRRNAHLTPLLTRSLRLFLPPLSSSVRSMAKMPTGVVYFAQSAILKHQTSPLTQPKFRSHLSIRHQVLRKAKSSACWSMASQSTLWMRNGRRRLWLRIMCISRFKWVKGRKLHHSTRWLFLPPNNWLTYSHSYTCDLSKVLSSTLGAFRADW